MLLKPLVLQQHFIRLYSSALYISGDKASKHFAMLTPIIDPPNHTILKNNLQNRSININVDKIIEKWQYYQNLTQKRHKLEQKRLQIGSHLSKLLKENSNDTDTIEKWKLQSKLIKDEIKNMKDILYSVDEDVHLEILGLPNALHKDCPIDATIEIHRQCKRPVIQTESHLVLANKIINFINPFCCYLNSDAALTEQALIKYLRKELQSEFTQFSSPDFSRSVVVEGCGKDFSSHSQVLTLQNPHEKFDSLSKLHLTGGAALEAYMVYFTKHFVQPNTFPLQYFSMGRTYQPHNPDLPNGLFNLCQESAVNIFIAYLENEEELLTKVKTILIKFYDSLNYHYKIEILRAKDLSYSESLKMSVQMYSTNLQKYVEVGNVTLYDKYLSKRLLFTTNVEKQRIFPKILFGTLINVYKFIGCAIENNSFHNRPLLNDLLKKYMFV